MKRLKRITALLLLVCLCVPCIPMITYAADVKIAFTDLETAVGETFTVRCKVSSTGASIGDVTLKMSYDTSYVQFMSGDGGVTQESAGQLIYQGTGDSDTLQFEMEFQALQEGQMRMSLNEADVLSQSGTSMESSLGYSDITIGEGDPSKIVSLAPEGPEVEVNGEQYTLSENFTEADIPSGFAAGTITYGGESYNGAVQSNGDMRLAYLVDDAEAGSFYVYDETNVVFTGFEQVIISDQSYIVLLQEDDSLSIPSRYQKKKLTLNGHDFPAWQDTQNTDYYLVYALNQEGAKGVYRYDSVDGTYQRFFEEDPDTGNIDVEEESGGLFGNISDYMRNHIDQFLIGAGMLLVLGLVFVIIIGVKLHNRNAELDEVYEELEVREDYESKQAAKPLTDARKEPKHKAQSQSQIEDDVDDYDDYDEEFEDDDLEDIRFDSLLSGRGGVKDKTGPLEDFDDYEDMDLSQTDDLAAGAKNASRSKGGKSRKKDDTFKLDIIDL